MCQMKRCCSHLQACILSQIRYPLIDKSGLLVTCKLLISAAAVAAASCASECASSNRFLRLSRLAEALSALEIASEPSVLATFKLYCNRSASFRSTFQQYYNMWHCNDRWQWLYRLVQDCCLSFLKRAEPKQSTCNYEQREECTAEDQS